MAQLNTPVIELVKMLAPPVIELVTVSDNALESWTLVSPFGRLDECAKFIIGDTEDAFALEDVATAGKEYTLSFWLKSDVAGYVRTTGGGTFKAGADWVKCVSTFTAEETGLSFSFDTPGAYYIYNTQLELGNRATDYRPATEDVDEGISNAQKAAEEAQAKAEASGKALEDFLNGDFADELAEIKGQIDKKAETWYQDADPALLWDTDEKKAAHAGDIWYDTVNKKSFIYMYTQSETEPPETEAPPEGQLAAPFITITSYGWHESDGVPQEVYDKIDGKAQIFSSQPTHPYYVEDLWVQPAVVDEEGNEIEPAGEIMICVERSTPAGFNEAHWAPASRYIGQAELKNWIDTDYADDLARIHGQLDGKSETWCQSTDPSLEWKDEAARQLHVGDLWLDPTTKETYIYTASGPLGEPTPVDGKLATPYIVLYSWEPTFEIPQDVFDRIDGKAQMFTEKPEKDYFVGDLYIEEPDEDGDREIYKCVKDYDPESANFDTDWAPVIDGKHLIKKINLSADEFQIEAKKIDLKGKVTISDLDDDLSDVFTTDDKGVTIIDGGRIDTKSLFAQNIEATGTITGMTFVSDDGDGDFFTTKMTAGAGELLFENGNNSEWQDAEHTAYRSMYRYISESFPYGKYEELDLELTAVGLIFRGKESGELEDIFQVSTSGAYSFGSKLISQANLDEYVPDNPDAPEANELYAGISGKIKYAGQADKAYRDGDGKVISDTYYPNTGGEIDGLIKLIAGGNPDLETVSIEAFGSDGGSLRFFVGEGNSEDSKNVEVRLTRIGNFYVESIESLGDGEGNLGVGHRRWNTVYAQNGDFANSMNLPATLTFANKTAAKQALGIDTGYAASISVPANGYVDKEIIFTTKFSETPHVICSLYTTASGAGNGSMTAFVAAKSATGATIRITNNGTTTGTRGVEWVAIGN